ncbi:MFS transporter [Alteromonas oceani]|uniref:MFS transporter n=1 Tax=Alteromonas oceani TaxID=2071609 RepID=A0ABV7JUF3_9ALTE|nr:MFS transporter [Alteromonas oceani]
MSSAISRRLFYGLTGTFILLALLGQLSTGIYTPFFAELAQLHGTKISLIEKSIAIFLIAFALSQLLSGIACDYLSKPRLLQSGLLLFILGTLLVAYANSPLLFLTGRVIQGLGGGVGVSVTRALSKQLFNPQQLNVSLSLTNIAFAIAPAIAPMLGNLTGEWLGIRSIFLAVLVVALLAFGLLLAFTPTLHLRRTHGSLHVMRETVTLLKNCLNPIVLIGTASGLLYGIVFGFVTISPSLIINVHGYSKGAFSLFSLLATMCFVLGSVVNIKLSGVSALRKFTASTWMILGLSCTTLLWITIMGTNSLWLIISFSYLVFFLAGIAMPCSVLLMLDFSATSAGLLAALTGFFHLTGASVGAYLVATIHQPPAYAFLLTTTALSLGSVITCAFIRVQQSD